MYVIRVIPVAKSILKEELSYFSKKKYTEGSLVRVPIRNKKIHAFVKEVMSVTEAKTELRDASFELKQLKDDTRSDATFSKAFMNAAQKTALYQAYMLSPILDSLIPKPLLEIVDKLPEVSIKEKHMSAVPEKLIFQDENTKRAEHYRSLVRESFARKESVFILVPSKNDALRLQKTLERGIEQYFINFTKHSSTKEMRAQYTQARTETHPLLIIGTGKYISVERHDIGTIIVEREASRAYRTPRRPFTDYRIWAELYAEETGARIIFADTMLRIETIGRMEKGELQEHAPLKKRLESPPQVDLIDMREKISKKTDAPALSKELHEAIVHAHENGDRLCIISARKGLSPVTYCRDCGTMVTCTNCGASMTLHTGKQSNFFLCHKCGERFDAHISCSNCDSWNLRPYGTGIEKVEQELKEILPKKHITRLDRDTAPTLTKAREKISEWKDSGTVLLGTERMLSFLHESHIKVRLTGIAGIDALFSIPDFRIYERIFGLLVSLGSLTTKRMIIDTHNPEHNLFNSYIRNDLMNFFREELSLRQKLSYPPYSTFIKISLSGKKDVVSKELDHLIKDVLQTEAVTFPALIRKKGQYTMHTLLKIPRTEWPVEKLSHTLALLPPRFTVHVDPESLLS